MNDRQAVLADAPQVAVIGLGTMGHGIAQSMAAAGCRVCAYDESQEARDSTLARITSNLRQMKSLGMVDDEMISATLARVRISQSESEALAGASFVTEAVSENLELKQNLFARLEAVVDDDAILASNTSSYPMSEIATVMRRPERALVTHWFNPPHIMPVVEVVPGKQTALQTTDSACQLLRHVGKLPVRLNQEIPGFLVNRVQIAMFREIWDLLDRGVASREDIDQAIKGSMGLRLAALGPLPVSDFAGWDITARVYENLAPDLRSDHQLPECIQQLVQAKNYGAKSGRGIYDYPAESLPQILADRDRTYLSLVQLLSGTAVNRQDEPSSDS